MARALHATVFLALGALALVFTWSQVMHWVVTREVPRHRTMFLTPTEWPKLFTKAFTDFMSKDGATNQLGQFFECTLGGPTLVSILYILVSSLRVRMPSGQTALGIGETIFWALMSGLVAPSTAIPWYIAYRAIGFANKGHEGPERQPGKLKKKAELLSPDNATPSILPPPPEGGFSVISLAVAAAYLGIAYTCAMFAYPHLAKFAAGDFVHAFFNKTSHIWSPSWWVTKVATDTNANPITRNLAFDSSFTMLAISLHTCIHLAQMFLPGPLRFIAYVVAPVLALLNFFTAGAAWSLYLALNEVRGWVGGSNRMERAKAE